MGEQRPLTREIILTTLIAIGLCCAGAFLTASSWIHLVPSLPAMAIREPTATPSPIVQPSPTPTLFVVELSTARPAPLPASPPASLPTLTPAPVDQPTPATPEERLEAAILEKLSDSNRDVARVQGVTIRPDVINIEWAINDNLTEAMTKGGARMDIAEILQVVQESGTPYDSINLSGSFSLVDAFGNAKEQTVIQASYSAGTVGQINWSRFLFDDVETIATSYNVHPVFRD